MNRPEPTQLWLKPGATIISDGRDYVILSLADVNKVFAKEIGSGEKVLIDLGSITPPRKVETPDAPPPSSKEIVEVSAEDWEVAEERRRHIDPLLRAQFSPKSKALADQIAKEAGVSRATIYRWYTNFRESGLLSSLLPNTTLRGGRGQLRLLPEVETIISDCIENFYDTDQQRSIQETVGEIRRRCFNAQLPPPSLNTVRARLDQTDSEERFAKRKGVAAARERFEPIKGSIPDADWPLALVQMDHTLLPIIIVDDKHRKSIRRAWITLAIDVFSRMCLGMHLSLDAPSSMSAGMCVANAILPKEKLLSRIGVRADIAEWPCWGVMGILHMDNAREFRGNMLRHACNEYDIDLHLRPVKKPQYGAHIERLMGTVSQGLKSVKGATFSGPEEKGEYDSEGNACMTFSELEKWLALFFARYHRKIHAGIGTTPLNKWREGLLGTKDKPGRGLPARRLDEEKLRIDFMPFIERTVQNYGVLLDDIFYFHDVLRPWINSPHPDFPRHKRKFRFHRDPRDISQIYFFDEIAQRYFSIPYRDSSLPPVSIWELREAYRRADERGIPHSDTTTVFALLNEQRALEEEAAAKTKSARRSTQRRTEHAKARATKTEDLPNVSTPTQPPSQVYGYNPDEVEPFDDDD